jgi:glycosyltransferase involved in cell wall biosynthesis
MKILQLTNKFPFPANDGGNIAVVGLMENFIKQGHDVVLLSLTTHKHPYRKEAIPEKFKSISIQTVHINTKLNPLSALINLLFSKVPYNAARFISTRFQSKLKTILKNDFDIIQLEGAYLCPYIPIIKAHSKAKIVYRAHNIEHKIWFRTAQREPNPLKRAYLKLIANRMKSFEHNLINQYDLLVPITKNDADVFLNSGNKKPVKVIPAGVSSNMITNSNEQIPNLDLFFIGALDWSPNQEGLIWFVNNVWDMVINESPQLSFFVAGRNAPGSLIKKINKPNIIFFGEIDDAYQYMNEHTVMILPLFSGSGMRLKIIEAMALGKTIISTSIGAEGINCMHKKNIFIADTAADFHYYIKQIMQNKTSLKQIGLNANDFIRENFDNFVLTSSLIDFYKKHI